MRPQQRLTNTDPPSSNEGNVQTASPWQDFLTLVDRTIPYLEPSLQKLVDTLRRPKRCLTVSVPIELDNGELVTFEGYRVHHNLTRGPGKGGLRYHPNVTMDEV